MITNRIMGVFGKSKSLKDILDERLKKTASTGTAAPVTAEVKEEAAKEVVAKKGELPPWLKKDEKGDEKKDEKKEEKGEKKEDKKDEKKEEKKDEKKEEKSEKKEDKKPEEKGEKKEEKKEEANKESAMKVEAKFRCPKCATVIASAASEFACAKCGAKLRVPGKIEKTTMESCAANRSFVKVSALTKEQRSFLADYWRRLYPAAYVDAMLTNF